MHYLLRHLIIAGVIAGLCGLSAIYTNPSSRHVAARVFNQTPAPSGAHGTFADSVDIGGRSLYLQCLGEGRPTVILESGSPFMDTSS